ncbi:hypothetical protein KJ632_02390 [Patescibacteria group bacterium]|nr:hypothetical protein [Patescibacteria group bacterium]
MEPLENSYYLENHELSEKILTLCPDSSEEEIKETFMAWGREVLKPIIEDIIKDLQAVRCRHQSESINYAIMALQEQKVVYCEMKNLPEVTTLSQFLALMRRIDSGIAGNNWVHVFFGMKHAGLSDKHDNELFPAIEFRSKQATRIANRNLDFKYIDTLREQFTQQQTKTAITQLSNETNLKTLHQYTTEALYPLMCSVFPQDGTSIWWEICESISPQKLPRENYALQKKLIGLKDEITNYLNSIPPQIKQHEQFGDIKKALFEQLDSLDLHLLKLETSEKVKTA